MGGQHRQRISADLVRGVAVGGDPVGAGDDAVDFAGRHQRGRRRIGDHRMRDAGVLELPRSQARALQERTRLVHPDVGEQAALPRRAQRPDRAAVAAGREATGIAVRQRARSGTEELCGVGGHRAAARDLLVVQPACVRRCRVVPHLRQRPGKVHGRRPRRPQRSGGRIHVVAPRGGKREPVGRGDADRRRAANRQLADRGDELVDRPALQLDALLREPSLVEEDDLRAVLLVPNDVCRL